jgi:biopolymer transport protein ExbD
MSEVNTEGKGGKQKGKPKKLSTRVDFTPMVDLMFLLLTFFMLATSMIKPQTMDVAMPDKRPDEHPTKINEKLAITILLDKDNKLYYYEGTRSKEGVDPTLVSTDYSAKGIRKYLLTRNAPIINQIRKIKAEAKGKNINPDTLRHTITRAKGVTNAPVIIIKATKGATYGNLVNILDEMQICNIGKYAVVDIDPVFDLGLIAKKEGTQTDQKK